MRKLLLLYILLMCNVICITAQELSPSKQINAIKRDSSFVYAEATDITVPQAYDAANVQLMLQIKEYIVSQGMTGDDILVKDKAAKCERIEMPRGDKYRVFVYVKKADIMSAQSVTVIPKSALQAMGERAKDETQDPTQDMKAVKENVQTIKDDVQYIKDNMAVLKSEETQPTAANENASVAKNDVTPSPKSSSIGEGLKEWQLTLINNLLNCTDSDDCLTFLNKMRIQNKVKRIGGKGDTPRNPQQVFYAIFNSDGTLKAVLGKENNGSRMNYMTKQADQLSKYSTDDQIWFTLSNF